MALYSARSPDVPTTFKLAARIITMLVSVGARPPSPRILAEAADCWLLAASVGCIAVLCFLHSHA